MQEKGRNEIYEMSTDHILYELYYRYENKLKERTGKLITRQRVEAVMKETHTIQFEQAWKDYTYKMQEELRGKTTLGKIQRLQFNYAEEMRIKEELDLNPRATLEVYQDKTKPNELYLVVVFRGFSRVMLIERLEHESVQTAVTISYRRNKVSTDFYLKKVIPQDLREQVELAEEIFL